MGVVYNTTLPNRSNLVLLVDAENPKCYSGTGTVVKNLANTFDDGVSDAANEFPGYTARSGSTPATFNFDGQTEANGGDHLAFPEELRNGRATEITIAALLYTRKAIQVEDMVISPSPGVSGDTGFRLFLSSYVGPGGGNTGTHWGFKYSSTGSEFVETVYLEDGSTINTEGDLSQNQWYFLAVTARSGNNDAKLFRNGNFVTVSNSAGGTSLTSGAIDWGAAGQAWRIADGIGANQRHGGIDLNFLGVWDVRFTDAEMKLMYEQLRHRVGL